MPSHYLIYGDALDILPKMKTRVDAVVVDPPYNTANKNTKVLKGRKARSSDFGKWDYFSDCSFLEFSRKWLTLVSSVLKKNGNLLVFVKLEYISDIKRIYEDIGFKHHGTIIWHKTNPAPQIRKTGLVSSCEAILWATNGYDSDKISYTFNFLSQNEMHNFIQTPICMGNERTAHPTQKPKKVVSHLIKVFTNKNDVVLDCFAGSGTVAEAAGEQERNTINIENNKTFYDVMTSRISKLTNSKRIGLNRLNINKLNNQIRG